MSERRRLRSVVLATAFLLTPAAPGFAAEDVSGAELRRLAAQAEADPAARSRLAEVRRVDGRPVDLRLALDTGDEAELRRRLRTLSSDAETVRADAPDEARARDDARRILDGRDFKPAKVPRPFRGALRKLGEWLRPVLEPFGQLFAPVVESDVGRWALIGFVLVGAAALARHLVQRRTRAAVDAHRGTRTRHGMHEDPDALERDAEAAERAGDLDAALRLRFRAGLIRLDRIGALEVRPSTTTGQLTRRVHSPALEDLATTFEAVAYGGRPAVADDVAAARRDWPRVLEGAHRS